MSLRREQDRKPRRRKEDDEYSCSLRVSAH
jgi:hypothetical protein